MQFVVSKEKDWKLKQFVMVPISLVMCEQLVPNSKLLLIFLMNQAGYKPISQAAMDDALRIHRTTRVRCIAELRDHGFIKGDEKHLILCDPIPILTRLKKETRNTGQELAEIIDRSDDIGVGLQAAPVAPEQRDYIQEATDSWNRYRPKDYQKMRRMSASLVKAVDGHMRDLGVRAHDYEQFFSAIRSGVEKDPWWAKTNNAKTLQSITGIGASSDKKRGNVFKLFSSGIESPATGLSEEDRTDTIVYPASYRRVIDDYDEAQTAYSQAYFDRKPLEDVAEYVVRTEEDLKAIGLDPAKFRYKYGISNWPTSTPEPEKSRVVNWTYDDEFGHVY